MSSISALLVFEPSTLEHTTVPVRHSPLSTRRIPLDQQVRAACFEPSSLQEDGTIGFVPPASTVAGAG